MKRKQGVSSGAPAKKPKAAAGGHGASAVGRDPLYRDPTGEELTMFREAEGQFRSNLMRMQISELLSEVGTESRYRSLDKALAAIKKHLEALPDVETFELNDESSWLPADTALPLSKEFLGECTEGATFSFAAPSSITVVGSYLMGTMTKPDMAVDLAVQMPSSLLDSGDHLNHRYVHKRAAYLCFVAHGLAECDAVAKAEFAFVHSRLTPILVVTPSGKAGRRFTIHIHVTVDESAFKPARLGPTRNCLRWEKFYGSENESDEPATPYYNSLLLRDGAMLRHMSQIHSACQECPAMADAIRLFKVWLRQRFLHKGLRMFNSFLAGMLAVHLLQTCRINKSMSSYHILRMLLHTLATSDWTKKGLFMQHDESESLPSADEFLKAFEVVFVDKSGFLNLTAHMSEASYRELVHEAKLSMPLLNSSATDPFNALFMTPVKLTHKYDQVIHVSSSSAMHRSDTRAWQVRCLADGGDWLSAAERYVGRVLRRGLGARAVLVATQCNTKCQWSVSKQPVQPHNSTLTLGLLLDHDSACSVVEQGPAADAPEADDFRAFWGQKSELRRFQDSAILEAVVWLSNSAAERRTIPARIVSHLLERHLNLAGVSVIDATKPYDRVLVPGAITRQAPAATSSSSAAATAAAAAATSDSRNDEDGGSDEEIIPKNSLKARALLALEKASAEKTRKRPKLAFAGTGEEETSRIMSVFDLLAKRLRAMEDLSLSIVSVQGASPLFRHTAVFPSSAGLHYAGASSLSVAKSSRSGGKDTKAANWRSAVLLPSATKCPPWTDAFDVVCHLEGSGQWPDDVEAIARVKASFYLQLAAVLEQKHSMTAVPTPEFLFVCVNGFVFRLSIAHAHELELLERTAEEARTAAAATPSASTAAATTTSSNPGHARLQRHTVALPLHTSRVHAAAQQFTAFALACRLAKRWLSCQLMSRFFSDEVVELLLAHVFLHPAPYQPPGSGISGLQRFLALIVGHSWATQPLFLNFGAELTVGETEKLSTAFSARRDHFPAMVIFTPSDHHSRWTSPQPSQIALYRCQQLAQRALTVLESQILTVSTVQDYQVVFRPSLEDYHVLIHLRSRLIPRRHQSLLSSVATEVDADDLDPTLQQLPVAGFDPVQIYLDQLEAAYGHVAMFFYDQHGGTTIGVVWTAKPSDAMPFKISSITASCPVAASKKTMGKKSRKEAVAASDGDEQRLAFNMAAALDDFRVLGAGFVKRVEVVAAKNGT